MRSVRCERSTLRALDFAIEMRSTRSVGAELDTILSQSILELSPDELPASVTLDALKGKGKLLEQMMLDKMRGVDGVARGVERQNTHARAIINGGELIEMLAHLAGVNLHSIPWNRAGVALGLARAVGGTQHRDAVMMQHLPDRACGEAQLVQA